MPNPFRIERLGSRHERSLFRCGESVPDRYFETQVSQDVRRRVGNCFVALEETTQRLAGYYTFSAASIPLVDIPPQEAKRLPRYPTVPAVLMGRLTVDIGYQGVARRGDVD